MPNPWDPFPIPSSGDTDDAKTYEGMGRAVSQWEAVEFSLARLYSVFANDSDGESISQYGNGKISKERLSGLRRMAEDYFVKNPQQNLEGQFDCLCTKVEGFAARRNEFAHSIVMPVDHMIFFQSAFNIEAGVKQYACIPPVHAFRNQNPDGTPIWAYTFHILKILERRMLALAREIDWFRLQILNRESGLPPR
jgi:hypothetical protein